MTSHEAAEKIRDLISKAPAGGLFHHALLTQSKSLHEGFSNETWHFLVQARDGSTVQVQVTEVHR